MIFHELGYLRDFLLHRKNRYFTGYHSIYMLCCHVPYSVPVFQGANDITYVFVTATFNLINRIKYMS